MARWGCVDDIVDGTIVGWAYDTELDTAAPLQIFLNGTAIGTTTGEVFRNDLLAAGIGDGRCGFAFPLPPVDVGMPATIAVRFEADDVPLRGGERVLFHGEIPQADIFAEALARGIWNLDHAVSEESISIEGWAIPPNALPVAYTILHNGVPPASIEYIDRPEFATQLGLPHPGYQFGYRATWTVSPTERDAARHEFALADRYRHRVWNPFQTITRIDTDAALPDGDRRRRVGGVEDEATFRNVGATAYAGLERVLTAYFGDGSRDLGRLLDWGCGCGRVFRYLPEASLPNLTGIDIDEDNIRWCQTHFPAATFVHVAMLPPTPLPAASFDTVIGISVFTHLTANAQAQWLGELARITKPGAAVLVSVLGQTAWLLGRLPMEEYAGWRNSGYWLAGKNNDLDGAVEDTSTYANCFITKRYIYEQWSIDFEVLDILDGAVANHQDLVVLRRR